MITDVKIPENIGNKYFDFEELNEWDLKYLDPSWDVWYWYAAGSYEGMGSAIIRKDGMWYLESLGHCSCYGPLECLEFNIGASELEYLYNGAVGLNEADEYLFKYVKNDIHKEG